jgi:hypothetical protein
MTRSLTLPRLGASNHIRWGRFRQRVKARWTAELANLKPIKYSLLHERLLQWRVRQGDVDRADRVQPPTARRSCSARAVGTSFIGGKGPDPPPSGIRLLDCADPNTGSDLASRAALFCSSWRTR